MPSPDAYLSAGGVWSHSITAPADKGLLFRLGNAFDGPGRICPGSETIMKTASDSFHKRVLARTPGGPSGFSLVELLVVIGIIGSLFGMLLPAVQSMRESSRKVHCSNNIRQCALGACAYESARKAFPAGCDVTPVRPSMPDGTQHAWSSFVLPFIEEQGLASRIDFRKLWDAPGGNDLASDAPVATYVCPSGIIPSVGKADYLFSAQLGSRTACCFPSMPRNKPPCGPAPSRMA